MSTERAASTLKPATPAGLKHMGPVFEGRSDELTQTSVSYGQGVRSYYLLAPQQRAAPPVISTSDFVPRAMIEHLMRNKKDSALGVKFVPQNLPPDEITNMEGAMHTYVTPLVPALMHGDYAYKGMHSVTRLPSKNGRDQARKVIVSGLIQPDFEDKTVMLKLASLTHAPSFGEVLPVDFTVPSVDAKQEEGKRHEYDDRLRRHMVAHLVADRALPSEQSVKADTLSFDQALTFLEEQILSSGSVAPAMQRRYALSPNDYVVSLELLFNSAVHQMRNEMSALEALCPQGYVYTFDPPSIFAREIDAKLLNRLQFAALKHLSLSSRFTNMRAFGFNDYADRDAIRLLQIAMSAQPNVHIASKKALFAGPGGVYKAPRGAEGAILVVHNNSDAFGQNIETEPDGGSMDGAIGANSSAAASLHRERRDLTAYLM